MHRNILWSGLLRMGSSVCLNEHNFGWQSSLLIDMNKNVTLVGEPILHGLHLAVAWALPPSRVSERKFTLSLHCVRVVGNTTGCALQHVEHSSFRFLWVLHIPIMIPNRNMSVQGMINTVHQNLLDFPFFVNIHWTSKPRRCSFLSLELCVHLGDLQAPSEWWFLWLFWENTDQGQRPDKHGT